jgi:tetratricopeptide (TPR) repeat protein
MIRRFLPSLGFLLCASVLCLTVAGVFWQAGSFDYINLDDHVYTRYNEWVQKGLSWEGVRYAFAGTRTLAIWFPLTMLSYMVDASIGGVTAQAFHLSSILWHVLATLALFLLLVEIAIRWTCAPDGVPGFRVYCACALGACFWAIHPQRIESVVWIASRKDLVSGLFAFLSLLFYLKSVRPSPAASTKQPCGRIGESSPPNVHTPTLTHPHTHTLLSLLCFVLAIMGKPVVMTLPLGMLVLEALVYRRVSLKRLLLPALLALACAANSVYMQSGENARHLVGVPLWDRVLTSFASIFYYCTATVCPDHVSIFHPWPLRPERLLLALGMAVCVAVAGLFVWGATGQRLAFTGGRLVLTRGSRRREAAFDGAILLVFFLGALFPMLNIFMFGHHSRADRFTYYPSLAVAAGLTLLLVWLLARFPTRFTLPAAALVLAGYGTWTVCETRYWRDTVTVFSRTDEVTHDNAFAACRLGENYMQRGDREKAERYFRKSIAIRPNDDNLGGLAIHLALTAQSGDFDEAVALAQQALAFDPESIPANDALGFIAMNRQAWAPAEKYLLKVVGRKENSGESYDWLGLVQYNQGKYREAAESFRQSMACNPQNLQVKARYAQALGKIGKK